MCSGIRIRNQKPTNVFRAALAISPSLMPIKTGTSDPSHLACLHSYISTRHQQRNCIHQFSKLKGRHFGFPCYMYVVFSLINLPILKHTNKMVACLPSFREHWSHHMQHIIHVSFSATANFCHELVHEYFYQCTHVILHSSQSLIRCAILWCPTIPTAPLAFFFCASVILIIVQDYINSVVTSTNQVSFKSIYHSYFLAEWYMLILLNHNDSCITTHTLHI
jgi:hypothetical protein